MIGIKNLSKEDAYLLEQKFIKFFDSINSGYNISPGHNLVSLETCKKISTTRKRKNIGQKRKNEYRYFQYSLDDKFINKFVNLKDIQEKVPGVKQSGLNQCLNGRIKTYYGFKWYKQPYTQKTIV